MRLVSLWPEEEITGPDFDAVVYLCHLVCCVQAVFQSPALRTFVDMAVDTQDRGSGSGRSSQRTCEALSTFVHHAIEEGFAVAVQGLGAGDLADAIVSDIDDRCLPLLRRIALFRHIASMPAFAATAPTEPVEVMRHVTARSVTQLLSKESAVLLPLLDEWTAELRFVAPQLILRPDSVAGP